jgi:hypothetical protein
MRMRIAMISNSSSGNLSRICPVRVYAKIAKQHTAITILFARTVRAVLFPSVSIIVKNLSIIMVITATGKRTCLAVGVKPYRWENDIATTSAKTTNVPITLRRGTVESLNLIRSIRHNDPKPKVTMKMTIPIRQSDLAWLKANKVGENVPKVRMPITLLARAVMSKPTGTKSKKDRVV